MATEVPWTGPKDMYWMQLQDVAGSPNTGTPAYPSNGRGGASATAGDIFTGPTDRPGRRVYRVLGVVALATPGATTTILLKDAAGNTLGTSIFGVGVSLGDFAPWPRYFTLPATIFNPPAALAEHPYEGVQVYDAFTVEKDQATFACNVLFTMEIDEE